MKEKYYITTAIAYTSGKPHIGNTYEAILADSVARFKRYQGYDVFLQTGTDEHGQKIEEKAAAAGVSPKAFVDGVADYVCNNDVADIDALVSAKNQETVEATAKIGEKISIRRFAKYIAENGIVESYIHMGGKVGVLVEIEGCTCDATKELAHDVALQIAAAKPLYLTAQDVPAEVLEHEKEILKAQALNEGKPANIVDRMVEGRVKKYYEEFCLVNQAFIKDPSMTIEKLVKNYSDKMGKTLSIKRFTRFEMGEGLEKKSNDFAAEVEAQMKK